MKKYQLAKYRHPTGNGGFRSVTLVGGFDSYISALLWKLITWHWNYRIESFELEDQRYGKVQNRT